MSGAVEDELVTELVLPYSEEKQWSAITDVLAPLRAAAAAAGELIPLVELDRAITALVGDGRPCSFFATVPGSTDASAGHGGAFDWSRFQKSGLPFILRIALAMPALFEDQPPLFVWKMRSSWSQAVGLGALGRRRVSLTRPQCACLLAHSLLGTLRRPPGIQPNDFRFTAVDLVKGTAMSPNSAVTFLNYFSVLGAQGFPAGEVIFHRSGYSKMGKAPWLWARADLPLCKAKLVDGSIEDCRADVHVEFAHAFVGGGVMTGDAAMEEMLFLCKVC